MRARWLTIGDARVLRGCAPRDALCPAPVLPVLRPARASGRSETAAECLDLCQRDLSAKFDGSSNGDPDVERWSTYVGRGAIRFYLPLNVQLPNDFFSQVVVIAKDIAARERLREKLERVLPEEFPSAVTTRVPLELGPPVGWPVQYRVSGPDVNEVRDIAFRLGQIVASDARHGGSISTGSSRRRKVRIRIDQDQARLLGLSSEAIAAVHEHRGDRRAGDAGAGRHLPGRRDQRATDEQRVSLSTLRTLQFRCPNGRTVPLSQIATFDFAQEYPAGLAPRPRPDADRAGRRDAGRLAGSGGRRAGSGDREAGGQPAQGLSDRDRRHGRGEREVAGLGVRRGPADAVHAVTFLMIQLQSFSRLFLVLSVVPMGLIGIVVALLLFRQPLGFVAILGILALLGMIARNASS